MNQGLVPCSKCGKTLRDTTTANCIIIEGGAPVCWDCALDVCETIIAKKPRKVVKSRKVVKRSV